MTVNAIEEGIRNEDLENYPLLQPKEISCMGRVWKKVDRSQSKIIVGGLCFALAGGAVSVSGAIAHSQILWYSGVGLLGAGGLCVSTIRGCIIWHWINESHSQDR